VDGSPLIWIVLGVLALGLLLFLFGSFSASRSEETPDEDHPGQADGPPRP